MPQEFKFPTSREKFELTKVVDDFMGEKWETAHRGIHFDQDMSDAGFYYLLDLLYARECVIVNVLTLTMQGKLHREITVRRHYGQAWKGRYEPVVNRILPCPSCAQEGESDPEATDLICPHCVHEWSVDVLTVRNSSF